MNPEGQAGSTLYPPQAKTSTGLRLTPRDQVVGRPDRPSAIDQVTNDLRFCDLIDPSHPRQLRRLLFVELYSDCRHGITIVLLLGQRRGIQVSVVDISPEHARNKAHSIFEVRPVLHAGLSCAIGQ